MTTEAERWAWLFEWTKGAAGGYERVPSFDQALEAVEAEATKRDAEAKHAAARRLVSYVEAEHSRRDQSAELERAREAQDRLTAKNAKKA
jgi:hypothetical protein